MAEGAWMRCVLLVEAAVVVLGSTPTFSEFAFTVEPLDTIAVAGQPALLNCSAHHDSEPPSMDWIRNGVYMNTEGDTRRYELSNGSLYFSQITHTRTQHPDEGLYQCVATVNNVGTIVSRQAKLQVAYLSKEFTSQPTDVSVHLGDTAMFKCDIIGAPKPTVRWYKDELELNTEHVNYRVHIDGVLEISSVQYSDFGQYKCRATNTEASRTSSSATLSQESNAATYQGVPPWFVMRPYDQVALEGSSVVLYCGANGRDRQGRTPTISWLKDGVTVDMADLDTRFTLIAQGSLQIDNVQKEDAGSYTCRATNLEDSEDADAALTVQVPPRFRQRPRNYFAHINSDVEFSCDVEGVPTPTIQWLKNGDVVIPSDYFQIVDGSNLRILGLVNSDEGLYQCTADNGFGNIQASAQLIILQQGSADADHSDLPSAPTDLVAAIVSTRFVTLSWMMPTNTGQSEIIAYSVFWKEQGSQRERVLNTTTMEANIQHLKPATSYVFRVAAYNRIGAGTSLAEITVETQAEIQVPGSPTELIAYALSPTSIKIQWGAPAENTGPITKYRLYYYKVGASEEDNVDANGREHILLGLKKFTEYSFRVVAYNSNGPGMSTDEITAKTFSDVPSASPTNITLETASSTSVIVRWEPPSEESCNGIITGYKIRYKRKGSRRGDTATTDGNRRAYALSDLQRGREYNIRVSAQTVNGSGPASTWHSVETFAHDRDESTVPGQPSSLRVRPMTNSIVVSWTPPSENNIMVRGYILGYGIGIPDVFKQVLDAKSRYHTIKNLVPSSEYVISLRSYNNMGEGRPNYETVVTREETTPEPVTPMNPPLGLKAIVLSSTTIVVTWSDTTLGRNQRITDNRFYTIRYKARTAKKHRFINSTDLNVHIDDLKPNSEYEFSVKVIKGRRKSTWSLSVFNKTFEAAPATAPRDVTPVAVEGKPTWIMLNWQPPRHPNGQVTGYLVFYTTDATQDDRNWVVEGVLGDRLSTTIRDLTPETTYYFKVQARNSKGYGPTSPTVIFRTPRLDGTGGGPIELPNDYGQVKSGEYGRNNKKEKEKAATGGIPPIVLWIVIGCVGGVTLIAVIVVTVIVCRRRMTDSERKRKSGYKASNKSKAMKGGPKDIKPPDLWIHDMELKSIDKNQQDGNGMTVTPIPRNSQEMKPGEEGNSGENNYDPHEEERYRRPVRAKPIMIPVDQPPPPREPIATAIPNGHLLGSQGENIGRDGVPIRPVYPRTQYTAHQYANTPRVHAGDISQPSSGP